MILQDTLTKENFWDEQYKTFPKACKIFCDWIDEYKNAVNWGSLFHEGSVSGTIVTNPWEIKAPKFHEIPHAMQQGIWIEFVNQTLDRFFEQLEYQYCGDLEQDIFIVFNEIETMITDDDLPSLPSQEGQQTK